MSLLLQNAANAAGDPEFTESARSYFMWMAIIALVVTWAWLWLRIRGRVINAEKKIEQEINEKGPGPT
ncbi:MAG: hypothetical protein KF696_05820 [Planctomycetes bacterium]|nr:hypothetical protein [Planctomycetota bacterium]MCW8136404.1 hypothetical protein [Planctomycetota bacterium]